MGEIEPIGGVYPFSIVDMDVFFHRTYHLVLSLIAVTADGFGFYASEKTIHDSIIPTIGASAHTGLDAKFRQPVLIGVAGVLATLAEMEQ